MDSDLNVPGKKPNNSAPFDLKAIRNLDKVLDQQVQDFNATRLLVKDLKFIPVDPVASYSAVTYKAIDGGKLGISFDPFELDLIKVADSYGNEVLTFLTPTGENLSEADYQFLTSFIEIERFLKMLKVRSIGEACRFMQTTYNAMEFAEYACIFERLARTPEEPLLLMKDGLLRTLVINPTLRGRLYEILREYPKQKLVGVAKSSHIVSSLGIALWAEQKIPPNQAGYIEIPLDLEKKAYKYQQLYQFGKLYVAKLGKESDLLVTVEIPYDSIQGREIYDAGEIDEIMGHLVKDAMYSFPTIGYPQTIMRAHEKAIATGFSASVWQDLIRDELLKRAGAPYLKNLFRDVWLLKQYIKKSSLGGL